MFELVDEALVVMFNNTETDFEDVLTKKAYEAEKEIDEFRTILKQQHLNDVKEKKYEYKAGIIYNDIFSECEKIGDYCINISQSISEMND